MLIMTNYIYYKNNNTIILMTNYIYYKNNNTIILIKIIKVIYFILRSLYKIDMVLYLFTLYK